ncbi:MAG: hypothetical protein ABSG44_11035 [Thermodesulfobacteriota bacterium]|jgi:hypothetical protein
MTKSYTGVLVAGWYGFKKDRRGQVSTQGQLVIMMIPSIPGSLFLQEIRTEFEKRIQVVIGTTLDAKGTLSIPQRGEEWTDRGPLPTGVKSRDRPRNRRAVTEKGYWE